MNQADFQSQMPDPLDVPVLVKKLHDSNTDEATALLESEPMGAKPLTQLLTTSDDLMSILVVDESKIPPEDYDMDGGWGGTDATLGGLERIFTRRGSTPLLAEEEQARQRASLLRDKWIGGNLKFLLLTYADEWREGDFRLKRLDTPMGEDLETPRQALEGLGLGLVLGRLQRLHNTYGLVLKMGVAHQEVEDKLNAFYAALDHFLSGLRFHFKGNELAKKLFLVPYEEALEAGRVRRKKIVAQRKARK